MARVECKECLTCILAYCTLLEPSLQMLDFQPLTVVLKAPRAMHLTLQRLAVDYIDS